jgi:serine-type D-Ala-D-Ala carboxypeptidase/endopeptidase (penicillin-binding protein 4)
MRQKIFILLFFIQNLYGQSTLSDHIFVWANEPLLRKAHVGVSVHDVNEGSLLASYNSDKFFVPASSLKVLTTLITLQSMGRDYTYETKIAYDGNITDSLLFGNVYILGSGDPSLASKRYADKLTFSELTSMIAQKIKNAGIKKIEGQIIADVSIFDNTPINTTWQWDDISSYYGAGVWGINVNENEYDLWYNTNKARGDMADVVSIVPPIDKLAIRNEVFIDDENNDDDAYIFGGPFDYIKQIKGSLPQSRNAVKIKGSIPDPPSLFAQNVIADLMKIGVPVNGQQIQNYKQANYESLSPIYNIISPTLEAQVKQANYHSLNMYCESFLKTLGYAKGGVGSSKSGISQIKNYLSMRNLDATSLNMEDGCGLSTKNLVTPSLLSSFLANFSKENGFDFTASLLPEVGNDGTVRRLLKSSDAKGKVWMKSGSMTSVMTYTGLMKAMSGRWVSFSVMVNQHTIKNSELRKYIEVLIDGIYKKV